MRLNGDYETKSRCDLKKHGAAVYAQDPTTEAMCFAYSIDGAEPVIWTPDMGVDYLRDLFDRADEIHAWNAAFEFLVTKYTLGIEVPIEKWRCTMARARYAGLPGGLAAAGAQLGLKGADAKDKEGYAVMMRLCKPNKKGQFVCTPEDFAKLCEYCKQDVRTEMRIGDILPPLPAKEQEFWTLDRECNDRGCPIDLRFALRGKEMAEEVIRRANVRVRELTGDEIETIGQVEKIKQWCVARGANIASLSKVSIEQATEEGGLPEEVEEMFSLRLLAGSAATKKYKAAVYCTSQGDGFAREQLAYYAAGTGRDGARGIQLQNLYRGKPSEEEIELVKTGDYDLVRCLLDEPVQVLQRNVRGLVCAPDGYTFVISDFSAIEGRVAAWYAGDHPEIAIYRGVDAGTGKGPYFHAAAQAFGKSVDEIQKGSFEYQIGKICVLANQYGSGANAFRIFAKNIAKLDLSVDFCEKVVKDWRKAHAPIVRAWRQLDDGFKAVLSGRTAKYNLCKGGLLYKRGKTVVLRLPSGRELFYRNCVAKQNEFVYTSNTGTPTKTYSTKIFENVIQALARDAMVDAALAARAAMLAIVLRVHDELVVLCRISESAAVKEKLHYIMSQTPTWANGLPVAAETGVHRRLTK